MLTLTINGKKIKFDGDPETPLLWVLRDHLDILSPKFGCGAGLCGACTVHLNGQALRSCQLPAKMAVGKKITTLEGLNAKLVKSLTEAWVAEDVPQCGYCQSGQIMSAAALLATHKNPTDAQITEAMDGNICRCGTYSRIKKAIRRASESVA